MTEIVLFHHARGLTAGVRDLADVLGSHGHTVHTPDLFEGRVFDTVDDGVAHASSIGEDVLAARAAQATAALPTALVYGGLSMGAARAAEGVLTRPGARGAFFLYGAVAPSWWSATWPRDVPSQVHVTERDPWREPEAEAEYVTDVPHGELFRYPGAGHLFAEPDDPAYDAGAAGLATRRILGLLAGL
ncbi:dienelactone hydrolase family protein [Isoptericola jiangsuensis]|uniref:dienelactone hydrolase family protein n=1 Tax=Isoptericola jiangsuensis TaxID=548579 RepID=UPI003AAD7DC8